MMVQSNDQSDEIVIHFRLTRDECPRLFENLAGIPKGPRRANRLKVLVVRGYDFEAGAATPTTSSPVQGGAGKAPATSILGDLLEGRMET
ncbi:MAG: hypothetical protein E6R14_12130 [Thermomicrobiales bacterium]|nr:MAG: hypothetical protein E6R14_12130 [Thermomicrobiales bacterium]